MTNKQRNTPPNKKSPLNKSGIIGVNFYEIYKKNMGQQTVTGRLVIVKMVNKSCSNPV